MEETCPRHGPKVRDRHYGWRRLSCVAEAIDAGRPAGMRATVPTKEKAQRKTTTKKAASDYKTAAAALKAGVAVKAVAEQFGMTEVEVQVRRQRLGLVDPTTKMAKWYRERLDRDRKRAAKK